jgi:hypothetical protein
MISKKSIIKKVAISFIMNDIATFIVVCCATIETWSLLPRYNHTDIRLRSLC